MRWYTPTATAQGMICWMSLYIALTPPPSPGSHVTVIVPTPAPAPTPVVNNIAQAASAWDNLWPLLVAAALALVATIAVQLFVVPLVDSRKRREQRWEEDVRTLGELLLFAQPKVLDSFWRNLLRTAALASIVGADAKRLETAKQENLDDLRAAAGDFDEIGNQIRWLTDRVISLAPNGRSSQQLTVLVVLYRVASIVLGGLMPDYRPGSSAPSTDEVRDGLAKMRKETQNLADAVVDIANTGPAQFRRR